MVGSWKSNTTTSFSSSTGISCTGDINTMVFWVSRKLEMASRRQRVTAGESRKGWRSLKIKMPGSRWRITHSMAASGETVLLCWVTLRG